MPLTKTALAQERPSQRWLLAIASAYSLSPVIEVGMGHLASLGAYLHSVAMSLLSALAIGALIFLPCHLGYLAFSRRPTKIFPFVLAEVMHLASGERMRLALPALAALAGSSAAFSAWKETIPSMRPFGWDVALASLDREIYGGYDLWQWLQPLFGHAPITRALDLIYPFYLLLGIFSMVWQIFDLRDMRLRHQYLMSCLLSWITLGTVAATIFSSAGPCFFGAVTHTPNHFAPLMQYLHAVSRRGPPLINLRAQASLWSAYLFHSARQFYGISAMPSMHIAMATLLALLAWRLNRWLGMLFSGLLLIVFIGSVELGWHYSLDGYAGAAGAVLIWLVVGRLQRAPARKPSLAIRFANSP